MLGVGLVVVLILGAVCLSFYLHSDDVALSDFQKTLADNVHVEFFDMPSMRSEIFPVIGRGDGELWQIALIEDDEIFFTSFPSRKEAEGCYAASIEQCEIDSLFLCGRDIIYYRGDNKNTIRTLQQFSSTLLE